MGQPINHDLGSHASDAAANAAWTAAGYPGSPSTGVIYTNTTDGTLRIADGAGGWISLSECIPLTYAFTSQGVGAGIFYPAGLYEAPLADANLDQAGPSVNYGSNNVGHCARAFLVAGGAGTVAAGVGNQVSLRVSGTSYDPATGTRTAADTEDIVADITTLALDEYVQSEKLWLGTITFALVVTGGAPATYSLDFNYGLAHFEDANAQDYVITCFEYQGLAGATDSAFDVELLAHNGVGWTYAAAAFTPGGTVIAQQSALLAPEDNLVNNYYFGFKLFNLATILDGSAGEGFVIRLTCGQPNSVQEMTFRVGIIFRS